MLSFEEKVKNSIGSRLHKYTDYEKIMSLQTHPCVQPYNTERKHRLIEDFYNSNRRIYLGKEMWIIGCGPSLDDFPNDFFQNKLTFAINWSIIEFPNSTHWWGDAQCLMFMKDYHPEIFRKTFFPFPYLSDLKPKAREIALQVRFGEYRFDPICVKFTRSRGASAFQKLAAKAVNAAFYHQSPFFMTHYGTSVHQAILISVYLGIKKITLVGCEAGSRDGLNHAERGNLRYFYGAKARRHAYSKLRYGTRFLANLLEQYSIRVRHYFYDKGYVGI